MSDDGTNQVNQAMRRRNANDIIPLDGKTMFRLAHLSRLTKVPVTELVASILHDVLEDDAKAHERELTLETCH